MSRAGARLVAGSRFVLRTPLLPIDAMFELGRDPSGGRAWLLAALERPEVHEAIAIASPSLAASLPQWRREPESPAGRASTRALLRYLSRMATRATPFGLFSGVAIGPVGPVGGPTSFELAPRAAYQRHTQLDNHYLTGLCAELGQDREIRNRLIYRPNSSAARQGDRIRYVEIRMVEGERTYELASVTLSDAIVATLERARAGARIEQLVDALVASDGEIGRNEAAEFIDQLIDIHLLVSELEPPVTGSEPLAAILDQLVALGPWRAGGLAARVTTELARASHELAALDVAGLGASLDRYRDLSAGLAALPLATQPDPKRIFQVQLLVPMVRAGLAPKLTKQLARGVELLAQLRRGRSEHDPVRVWARAFRARYEDREVPLLDALDEDIGVGFEPSADPPALLDGVRLPGSQREPEWIHGRPEQFLVHRLGRALAAGEAEIALSEAEIEAMTPKRSAIVPEALAVIARVAPSQSQNQSQSQSQNEVWIAAALGPSGARLLGRHCHASTELREAVEEHLAAEAALRPDAILAEVVHLDQGRIGNIACRPNLRKHEIAFLGVSGADRGDQIGVDDLLVSVRDEQVVLRSRRLDRRVIPRMTNAHNHRIARLTLYRFLCALQDQEGAGELGFAWPAQVRDHAFLPRLRHGQQILARARWLIRAEQLGPLRAALAADESAGKRDAIRAAMQALRVGLGLPRHVVVSEFDNELWLDFDNPSLVESAAWHIARRNPVIVHELWPTPERALVQGPEGRHAHELVVTFTRAEPVERARVERPRVERARVERARRSPAPPEQRSFAPGSEWLYAKLYTGVAVGDAVLREVVAPVRELALRSGAADRWFFLRYQDPEPHLRLRFHGPPARLLGEVLPALHRAAEPWLAEGRIHRLCLDTYERELERYAGCGIERAEALFHHDSEAALAILDLLDDEGGADARWRLTLRGIDMLWTELGLDGPARLALALAARDNFRREFEADTETFAGIGARFRRERASVVASLERDPQHDRSSELAPGYAILDHRSRAIAAIVEGLDQGLKGSAFGLDSALVWSLGHMHANRLLPEQPRAQELVLYDFLHRFHAARQARA